MQILVSVGVLESVPYRYQKTVVSFEGVKHDMLIFNSMGLMLLTSALFMGQL